MKIWQVGAAPDPRFVSGVSRTVWLLSLEQAQLGHDVSLILEGTPTDEAVEMARGAGLKLVDVTTPPLTFAQHVRQLLDTAPPDVVNMHSVFIPRQAVMGRMLKQQGVPYIITPHAGLAPQVLARGRLKKTVYSAVRERPRFMSAAAVALVTPAEEKAVRAFIPNYSGIVRWMPNPVEVEMLNPARWHGLREPRRLVFLGRFDVLVKGIDILVEIARRLPEVQVDLYGTEDPKTHDWLMKLKANLPPNIAFYDPVFGQEKAEILANASIYIQPSRWEGFPVSVAECLYLGVPSAITESLDLAQLFGQHDLGLVLSLDPQRAAEQLREALSDEARMQSWSQRGRVFAESHFLPAASAQRYLDLYTEVINQSADTATTAPSTAPPSVSAPPSTDRQAPGRNGHARASIHRLLMPAGMRNTLKQNVSRLVQRGGEMMGTPDAPRSIVLCYHSISDQANGLSVSPESFRRQLAQLGRMGYQFLTFGQYVDYVMRWGLPASNVAVITFDDGYEDNLREAAPILTEMDVPATFFLTSGLVQSDQAIIDRFKTLTGYDTTYLSPPQVRQMHEMSFEIAAHTHSHPNLARLPAIDARREIELSKKILEDIIGDEVRSFAYPFGKRHIHYLHETADFVREAAFRGAGAVAFRAVTSRTAVRIFEIPRFFITRGDNELQFQQKVAGQFDWVGGFQEHSPAWLKGLVSPEDRY